jgi:hypothetical protein
MLPHLWETDPRDSFITIFLPASMVGNAYQGTYGFYMLSLSFWVELLLVSKVKQCFLLAMLYIHSCLLAIHAFARFSLACLLDVVCPSSLVYSPCVVFFFLPISQVVILEACAAAVTGALLYKLLILGQPPPSSKQQQQVHDNASVVSKHLWVYGVILPFWIICPYYAIQQLDFRHLIFKFAAGVITPTLTLFRTTEGTNTNQMACSRLFIRCFCHVSFDSIATEPILLNPLLSICLALYGFTPKYATKSARRFAFYFSCPVILAPDKEGEFVQVPFSKTLRHLKTFSILIFVLGMYSSWMITFKHLCVYSYGPPPADDHEHDDWYSFHRLFTWQLYANNLFQAILFQLVLQTYCEGLMFVFSLLCGYEIMPVMDNPVFASRSPSDFWGRRWNLLVHEALKNGVFKPARRYMSKTAAVAVTFLVSGIFHEWLLIALHASSGDCSNCFSVVYGSATIFFAWQGILVSIESLVGHWSLFTKLDKILPMPVRTALIIASGIPVSTKMYCTVQHCQYDPAFFGVVSILVYIMCSLG